VVPELLSDPKKLTELLYQMRMGGGEPQAP